MNSYFFKIKRIVLPGLGVLLATAAGYGLLVWVLVFGLPAVPVKKEVLQAYLPLLFGSLFFLFALSKRFRIIYENPFVQMSWRGWLQMLTWLAVLVVMILSYNYVHKRFAVLADVADVGQIDSRSATGYYRIADWSVQSGWMGNYAESRTIPKRSGSDVRFTVYVVFPFAESGNVWYAINYSKKVDRGSDQRLQQEYAAFLKECDRQIARHDFARYPVFEKVPASDERDGFMRAIERVSGNVPAEARDVVILRPLPEGYPGQSGASLRWLFFTLGIWLAAMLLLLYFAPLNHRLLNADLTPRKAAESDDDDFLGAARSVLIPGKRNWPVTLIVDAILIYFVVMLIGGVNPFSPSSQELFEWGALRSASLRNGEWWRVVTSMFMHAHVVHLVSNLVALGVAAFFGVCLFKSWKTAVIFFISGVCAGTAAAWFFEGIYVGASGAIMGLQGAILAVYICYRKSLNERVGLWWVAGTSALTLLIGIQAGISNTAHIVGLLTGAMLGLLFFTPPPPKRRRVTKKKGSPVVASQPEPLPGRRRAASKKLQAGFGGNASGVSAGETVVVRMVLAKKIKLLLICILLTSLSVFCVATSAGWFMRVIGIIGTLFFGFGVAGMLYELRSKKNALVIRPDGFEYQASLFSTRFVPWGEVDKISLWNVSGAEMVCVSVKDRKKFEAAQSRVARCLSRSFRSLPPIQLSLAATQADASQIALTMKEYLNRYAGHQKYLQNQ